MKTGIIAFCGSKGAGKDTSANLVKELFTGPIEHLAFAGHLKNVCSKVLNIDMKYFTDPALKEVELDTYVVLTKENVEAILRGFDVTNFTYDVNVRLHVGQVFDTPRQTLQYVGTELLHPIDPLIHAKMTLKNKNPDALTLITDLRFQQEFNYLKNQADLVTVYVANDKAESFAGADGHKSERELQLFKHECVRLDNNGSLTDLKINVSKFLEKGGYQ
jgi:hypothetical protein